MLSRTLIIGLLLLAAGCGGAISQAKLDAIGEMPLQDRILKIEQLMEQHPEDTRLTGMLGRALWSRYDGQETGTRVESIKSDLRAEPENAVLSKLLGDAYYDMIPKGGNTYLDSALFAYENAALKAPTYLGAIGSVGALYDEKEDYDQAIHWYEKALALNPDHITTICNVGGSYYNKGEFNTAIDYYRRALEVDADSQDAHYNLGVSFAEASIYREAIKEWRTVVEIDSTTAVAKQARTNADLLEDVLGSTVYKNGKRSRMVDMSKAKVTKGTTPPGASKRSRDN